ncbi:MAG: putative Ribokinase, partial [Candidatus Berkelbacteria bacterium Gr01-1014_85]
MHDLITVGDAGVDVFLALADNEAEVNCRLDRQDCRISLPYAEKIPIEKLTKTIAMNACNVAVGAARLGLKTALIASTGTDPDGQLVRAGLKLAKVDSRYLGHQDQTNFSAVINYQGERTILVHHAPHRYHWPKPRPTRGLYLTSMKDGWESIIPELTDYLERHKPIFGYNPGTYQLRQGIKVSRALLKLTTVLFVNRQEAERYLELPINTPVDKLLHELLALGPKQVVITDGPTGAYYSDAQESLFIATYQVPVVERTGCGDAFATGFMAARLAGQSTTETLRWASFEAAAVLQEIGPQAGYLTKAELTAVGNHRQHFQAVPLMQALDKIQPKPGSRQIRSPKVAQSS